MKPTYQPVSNKIRVCHYPQIPCAPFRISVNNEWEAYLIKETLAKQHLWLFENNFIPDYCNIITVEIWDDVDGEGNFDWTNYYNESECMDWDEFKETYFNESS